MITWYWLYRFSVSRGHISKPSVSDTRTEQNPCMTLISTLHICPFDSALCSFTIMNSPKMWNRYLYICIHGVWFLWCFAMIFNDIYMIYIYIYYSTTVCAHMLSAASTHYCSPLQRRTRRRLQSWASWPRNQYQRRLGVAAPTWRRNYQSWNVKREMKWQVCEVGEMFWK